MLHPCPEQAVSLGERNDCMQRYTKACRDARCWIGVVIRVITYQKAGTEYTCTTLKITSTLYRTTIPHFILTNSLRGLHNHRPFHAQARLIRRERRRLWDVAVDIRKGFPA